MAHPPAAKALAQDKALLRSRAGIEWIVVNTSRAVDRTLASVELITRSDADAGRMQCSFSLPAPAFRVFCCANGINGRF